VLQALYYSVPGVLLGLLASAILSRPIVAVINLYAKVEVGAGFTTQFSCFTGTNVQILTPEELQEPLMLLPPAIAAAAVLSLLALLVQKHKY
jgi:hypothetical protein